MPIQAFGNAPAASHFVVLFGARHCELASSVLSHFFSVSSAHAITHLETFYESMVPSCQVSNLAVMLRHAIFLLASFFLFAFCLIR